MVIDGKNLFAKYSTFNIKDESDSYRLQLGSYSGTVGENSNYGMTYHNGQAFTTLDRDNDESSSNCAVHHRGAWWYRYCASANLNGLWGVKDYKALAVALIALTFLWLPAGREASTLRIVFWSRKLCFQTSRRTRLPDPSGSGSVQLPTAGPQNLQTVVTDYSPSHRTGRTIAIDFKAYKYFINLNIIVFWPN
ncbi:angiopoietin-related protein 1 [Elysia marginata]|uniref:Angiopoietin-related protein 1 n=1 Tax=Elysia marginata TaxID=1093978 RepID=A0AAV4FJP0_9GAST|nr:angiopoietin-related protein 1 [Elysia marginata]